MVLYGVVTICLLGKVSLCSDFVMAQPDGSVELFFTEEDCVASAHPLRLMQLGEYVTRDYGFLLGGALPFTWSMVCPEYTEGSAL